MQLLEQPASDAVRNTAYDLIPYCSLDFSLHNGANISDQFPWSLPENIWELDGGGGIDGQMITSFGLPGEVCSFKLLPTYLSAQFSNHANHVLCGRKYSPRKPSTVTSTRL
jgi:hypothetical protein